MNGVAVIDRITLDCIYGGFKRYPENGEELFSDSFGLSLGGGACVVPIRLSKMNVPVRLGTFLGNDALSNFARSLLSDLGLSDVTNFYAGGKCPVIYSTIFSSATDRSIMSYDAGVNEITEEAAYDFYKGASVCVSPKSEYVAKKLKRDGTKILCDAHWEEGQTLSDYIPVIKHADFFTPNDKEAMFLTDTETPEEALVKLSEYTKNPIVKTGADGCIAIIGGEIKLFPTAAVKTVDTTGAGDNFLAGLAFGVYKNLPAEQCIRLANFAGARSTEGRGCYAADYDLNEAKI